MENNTTSDLSAIVKSKLNPYVVQYVNTTNKPQRAVLFGFNLFCFEKNFGNPKGISITNLNGSSYGHLLSQSAISPFKASMFRFQSSNQKTLLGVKTFIDYDADGSIYTEPKQTFLDPYQYQSGIVDYKDERIFHGNAYMTFELAPKSTMVVCIFPTEKIDLSSLLRVVRAFFSAKVVEANPFVRAVKWFKGLFKKSNVLTVQKPTSVEFSGMSTRITVVPGAYTVQEKPTVKAIYPLKVRLKTIWNKLMLKITKKPSVINSLGMKNPD